jgi:phage terminase large subunit-like protein
VGHFFAHGVIMLFAPMAHQSALRTTLVVDKQQYYLLDLTRGRYAYPRLRGIAVALAEQYKPDAVPIEEASVGYALVRSSRRS